MAEAVLSITGQWLHASDIRAQAFAKANIGWNEANFVTSLIFQRELFIAGDILLLYYVFG